MQSKGQGQLDDAFIGRLDFGRYNDKQVAVTTYGDEVYVHIKDRSRGNRLSLRGTDYLQLLKKKGQVTTLLEQGGKHIAKKRKVEDSFFSDAETVGIPDSDTETSLETSLEETIKKYKQAEMKKRQAESQVIPGITPKPKKQKVVHDTVSSLSSSDESTDDNIKEQKATKKELKKKLLEAIPRQETDDESIRGVQKKHKKK